VLNDRESTQYSLAIALRKLSGTLEAPDQIQVLKDAVKAYREALLVWKLEDSPQDWATAQNNLIFALRAEAELVEGDEQATVLKEIATAYRAVLRVRTRQSSSQKWAETQDSLGVWLWNQAKVYPSSERVPLYREAESASEAALEVRTKTDFPKDVDAHSQQSGSRYGKSLESYHRSRANQTIKISRRIYAKSIGDSHC